MIRLDEDALCCDLAEVYNIYDFRSLPMRKVATFSVGLGENSRIQRKINGRNCSIEQMLLGSLLDRFTSFSWSDDTDPPRVIPALIGQQPEKEKEHQSFASGEDFMNAWRKSTGVNKCQN